MTNDLVNDLPPMHITEHPLVSLRYTLSLPEAQDGFRLATRQRKGNMHLVMTLACALIIAWGLWLGLNDNGRYFVILGAFFFLSQATLQYGVMPWLLKRQYYRHQVGNVLQGIDLYADMVTIYHGEGRHQDQQSFTVQDIKNLHKGQLSYVLVFTSGMMCMIPRHHVEQAHVVHLFEETLLKSQGVSTMGNPAGQGNLPDHRQSDGTADAQPQLPEAAIAALSQGCKIDAIKLVHQQQGLGLKDSKDLVEAYMRQHPQLRNAPAMQGVTARKSRYSMTVGVLVLLLVALMLGLMFF